MIRNIWITFGLWMVFVGGAWAYRSRRRDGLRNDPVDVFFAWLGIIVLGAVLLNMIGHYIAYGDGNEVP